MDTLDIATHRHIEKPIEVMLLHEPAYWEPTWTLCVVYKELNTGLICARPDFHQRYQPIVPSTDMLVRDLADEIDRMFTRNWPEGSAHRKAAVTELIADVLAGKRQLSPGQP